jgi:2-haloacid dehalogenase
MPDIRAVVFDFGGVLFDWSAEYLYRELIPDDEERRWFLTHVCSPAWNLKQDCGRPIAEAEAELIALYPDHADLIRAFYGQWPKTLRGLLDDGVALLEQLHEAGVPLYGLTNWSAETYHHVEGKYDFMKRFRHVVVSGRIGMVKPDPRIFAHLLEHVREPAERCVFIDDSAKNAEAASALGLHGITHRSAAETGARLRALGVAF